MKKLSPVLYRQLFFKHLWRFLGNVATPHELKGAHLIAVSGGMDSMALLWVASFLHKEGLIGPVRAFFVHHNTREGQQGDAQLIEKFCRDEGIPFYMVELQGLKLGNNFEARARKLRRKACLDELRENELLWVGHHIDDSYEWNFMQRHRSYNPRASIGIPVRNGKLIRPFHCVSRAQIKRLIKFEGIPFRDDPTNWDLSFDRNYIRHVIIPKIKKKYPRYLKFYSHFANFQAMSLKVSYFNRGVGQAEMFAFEKGALLVGTHFSEFQIQEIIHFYSSADRGEIITPIQRMLKAIDNNKKGPFHFSGGIEAYYTYKQLILYQKSLINHDEDIARVLSTVSNQELMTLPTFTPVELKNAWQNLLKSSDALQNLPGLVLILESDSICKTLNTSNFDSLFPRVSDICRERGLRFMPMLKCVEEWQRKKEKLPKTLRLLPLVNLSNLFSFQE